MSSNSKRVHHCGVCRLTGHRADSNKFHPRPIKTQRITVPVPDSAVPVTVVRDVIEHVAITEVSLDDIPAYAEPGLTVVPGALLRKGGEETTKDNKDNKDNKGNKVKHLGVYSTMITVIQRVTSGELQEDTAKDILIALTKCL